MNKEKHIEREKEKMADYVKNTANTFSYEVKKHIGTIAEYPDNTKEINLICYNHAPTPKYDIRTWTMGTDGKKRLGKGLTLSAEEMANLKEIISSVDIETA